MRRGILLASTGSPSSYDREDVKTYLREFLMDEHILDMPYFLRWFLVNKIIVNKRSLKVSKRYEQIWMDEGSPLHVYGNRIAARIEKLSGLPVVTGMNYSQPSFAEALRVLKERGVVEVLVIPLFPHYAYSTYVSLEHAIGRAAYQVSSNWQIYIKKPYYNDAAFINIYADFLQAHWQRSNIDVNDNHHVLFSYHSIPYSHLQKADKDSHCLQENCCEQESAAWERCYKKQTQVTTHLLAEKLQLQNFSLSYQSRFLGKKWLSPFTDKTLEKLGKQNVSLSILSPAFVIDNLETLEELGIRGKASFLQAGGKAFDSVPALNASPTLAHLFTDWCINENLHDFFFPLPKKL